MEKDIGKIPKNEATEIVIRIDDFGGRPGLTIREFVTSDRYTGFTKAGTRIPATSFSEFKKLINSIDEKELSQLAEAAADDQETQSPDQEKLDIKEETI